MKRTYPILLLSLLVNSGPVFAENLLILTDGSWKSFNQNQPGWNLPDFDDTSWRNAYENYVGTLTMWGYSVPTIWDWPYATKPAGYDGPIEAFFRKRITLSGPVLAARFNMGVDDEMDLYVNGTLAYRDRDRRSTIITGQPLSPSLFFEGENVIAVYAYDGGSTPYDRMGETIYAAFEIQTEDCQLAISALSGEDAVINPLPLAGQSVTISATIDSNTTSPINWQLTLGDILLDEGNGPSIDATWDGRTPEGLAESGEYTLMLSADTPDGRCHAEASLPVAIDLADDCKLHVSFAPAAP